MINTGISNLDDKFLSKEDFNEFVDVKMKNNFNSVLNTINTHYNVMIDWQKKSLVITFIISLMLVLTLITSMIINYSNIKKMTESIEILTEQMAEQKVQMAELKEDVAKVRSEIADVNSEVADLRVDVGFEKLEEAIEEIAETKVVYNTTDIAHKSGYTAEQFDAIINKVFTDMNKKTTSLTTIGYSLYKVEQENDVNGLHLLGIASFESGWGTSSLAIKSNNLYGLIGCKFNSVDKCTEYMGSLLRSAYIDKGLDTLAKIQTKYCPNGGSKWINDVTWCTNRYINAANELYPQQ